MGPVAVDRQQSQRLWERAQRLIPGGFHTYSKGDDQFPVNAPRLIERAEGCTCWDPDGGAWLDWGMGLRTVTLGHAFRPVLEAVARELSRGSNFTRPSRLEGELAEVICEIVPCAEMVKFAKTGSNTTSAAIRLARAVTGRDLIAYCQDNVYYSLDDWCVGTTPCSAGVPEAISRLSVPFAYGNVEGLEQLFAEHPKQIACLIIEPFMTTPYVQDRGCRRCACYWGDGSAVREECESAQFLRQAVEIAHRHGALAIFDEMISGFRWDLGGAQRLLGVVPDLATFGKGIANGFSVAVLAGRREFMELGGLAHAKKRPFLLSSTHGAETHGLAAALATIRTFQREPVIQHLWAIGRALMDGVNQIARQHGIAHALFTTGYPCSPLLMTLDGQGNPSAAFRTLALHEMARHGILIPYITPSFAHREEAIERTLAAFDALANRYAKALEAGGVSEDEVGPFVKPVFRAYN